MRVLHVVTVVDDDGKSGGALAVAVNQCVELRRRGHDARIAGGWGGRGPAPRSLEGVPVHLFRARTVLPGTGPAGLVAPALLRWLGRSAAAFDTVHLHLARELVPLLVAGRLRRAGVPYVAQPHGALGPGTGSPSPLVPAVDRRLTRPALLGARHVFAVSAEERDAVARVCGTARNVSLLRGGVVLPERVPVRAASGAADVLFLGRLQPNRRVMAFAAAADRLVADGVDATFAVVGPDGGDLRTLRRFIADRPHLAGRLRYEGALPHERAVARLRRADLYVLPSVDRQAHPVSLLEAMAAGVPAICTTECSLAGVLAREHAAIVANPTDDALYGAMRRVLTDRTARARLSVRAAATAASEFSMAPVAEVLEEEYGAAAASRGQAPAEEAPADPAPAPWSAVVPAPSEASWAAPTWPAVTPSGSSASAPSSGPAPDAGPVAGGEDRRRLLWVVPAVTQAHVEVWDALRAGARLTVALVAAGDAAGGAGLEEAALAGRGYPVLRLPARPGRAPRALRTLLADRPHALVLDGLSAPARAAAVRWARRAGVPVVTASDADGPGAAARAALAAGRDRTSPVPDRIDLDLRDAGTAPEWLSERGPHAGAGPDRDVIDLQQRSRSSGRHRA